MTTPSTMTPTETPAPDSGYVLTDDQIRHMVDRFLAWRLPEDFSPDDGITFKAEFNAEYMASLGKPPMRHEPQGTNLLDARQAEAMVRHMVAGLPLGRVEVPGDHPLAQALRPSPECLAEIRDMEAQNAANVRALLRGESDAGRAAPEGGYVLVPREPSDEAIQRAIGLMLRVSLGAGYLWAEYARDLYRIMVVEPAAPSPAPEGEVEEVVRRLKDLAAELERDDNVSWLAVDEAIALIRRLSADAQAWENTVDGLTHKLERSEAERDKARATTAYILDRATYGNSYGVPGSDFQACHFCMGGGAPGVELVHAPDCPLSRYPEAVSEWFAEMAAAEAERDAAVKWAEDAGREVAKLRRILATPTGDA